MVRRRAKRLRFDAPSPPPQDEAALSAFFNRSLAVRDPPPSGGSEALLALAPYGTPSPEDVTCAEGNLLSPRAARRLGVLPSFLSEWLGGVRLASPPPDLSYRCDDYPLYARHALAAGDELDRLTALSKIHWYEEGCAPSNLCVCPSNVVVKPGRIRVIHDWSHPDCGLNSLLPQPPVAYGSIDSFLSSLKPSAWMAGLDLKDCFFHWPIHPSCRHLLGVRHPVSGRLGSYLFLPFGLGPSPGINDRNVKELIRVVVSHTPGALISDFVDDLRLSHSSGTRAGAERVLSSAISCLTALGVQIHSKPGKLILPTTRIPWIGFVIDTGRMCVSVDSDKIAKGVAVASGLLSRAESGSPINARDLASAAGFLSFLAPVVPGAGAHLHFLWDALNRSCVRAAWARGRKSNPRVVLCTDALSDLHWWVGVISQGPSRPIFHWSGRSFIWHCKLSGLPELLRSAPPDRTALLSTDASGSFGWGAAWGEHTLCGSWDAVSAPHHINWKELYAIYMALASWGPRLRKRAVVIKSDNTVAIAYANRGRGKSPILTALARNIKALEASFETHLIATHIRGDLNVIADALSRDVLSSEADPLFSASLCDRFWSKVSAVSPEFSIDAMCDDDGLSAKCKRFCCPSHPPFENDLSGEHTLWFPPPSLLPAVLRRVTRAFRNGELLSATVLVPCDHAAPWFRLLSAFRRILTFPKGASLFVIKERARIMTLPPASTAWWVVAVP